MRSENFERLLERASRNFGPVVEGALGALLRRRRRSGRESVNVAEALLASTIVLAFDTRRVEELEEHARRVLTGA